MAEEVQDDGFHEIQLNGKQLVFVFMTATLVSIVIFLFGVLVGRNVQRDQFGGGTIEALNTPAKADAGLDPAKPVVPPTVPPGADPTRAIAPAPPASAERSVASARPGGGDAPRNEGKSLAQSAPNPPSSDAAPRAPVKPAAPIDAPRRVASTVTPDSEPRPTATTGDGPQSGWVIQVASVDQRGEADAIAARLSAKGYSTFVLASGANRFRVRVGGFKSKDAADAAAAQLRKVERIEPWVTR